MVRKSSLCERFARYGEAQNGGVIPLIGLAFFVMIGMMGMAIDIGRGQMVESKLLNTLDAAGLAAGAKLNSSNVQTEVEKFVHANFPDGYVDATISNIVATVSDDEKTITVSATATLPTAFMQLFGTPTMDVNATSEITRAIGGLELVLVLDNTGSMSGQKLDDLKSASGDLLDIVFGDDSDVEKLYVGVVPFSQAVNVGPSRSSWLAAGSLAALDWGPTSWMGCVEARTGTPNRDVTDAVPATEAFQPYYWDDDVGSNDWKYTYYVYNDLFGPDYFGPKGGGDALAVIPVGHNSGSTSGGSTPVTGYRTPLSTSRGPNKRCPAEVTPMTSNRSNVDTAINAMTAVGNTHINLGAVWGWRMLSPNWRGLWGGSMDANNLPLDYNTATMNKAIVVMTDGDNTMPSSNYTAYGTLSEGNLGTTSSSAAVAEMNSRLSAVCSAMKNAGINVYTITFGSGVSSTSKSLMRSCASQSDFYFNAEDGVDLSSVFTAIGDSLSNLRVSR